MHPGSGTRNFLACGALLGLVALLVSCSSDPTDPLGPAPESTTVPLAGEGQVPTEATRGTSEPTADASPVDDDFAAALVGRLVGLSLLPEDVQAGRFSDQLIMDFEFENMSQRSIRAITGIAVFNDLFDREIRRIGLTYDKPIGPGMLVTDSGRSLELNQFLDSDNQLKSKSIDQLNFRFDVRAILWSDGSIAGEVDGTYLPASGPTRDELRAVIDVTLDDLIFIPEDIRAGRFSDYLQFELRYMNKSEQDVRAFTGQAIFLDLFGREIKRLALTYDTPINASQTVVDSDKAFELNQFLDDDRALASTERENMTFVFEVDSVLFGDGTRIGQTR